MTITIAKTSASQFPPYNAWLPNVNATCKGRVRITESIGVDLEWDIDSSRPSIIGVANGDLECYSVQWNPENEEKLRNILSVAKEIVGHNIITGDIPILLKNLVFPIVPERKFDTFIYFYLTNAHLCKSRSAQADDSDSHKGGGFMNIWTMASLYTDLPNWKECRDCHSSFDKKWAMAPCPKHQPYHYNAIDALAPLMARDALETEAKLKRVDHLVPVLNHVSEIASRMTGHGIAIDEEHLSKLEGEMAKHKAETLAGLPANVNWQSNQQVLKYFKDTYGVAPANNQAETIEAFAEQYDYPEAVTLVELKSGGKGLKSWFDRRYITEGLLHPQFKPAGGASTGRWASSQPNFQNIPRRSEWAKKVRSIICARPDHLLYKADYRQAEARAVLYQAGYDVPSDGSFKQWLMNEIALDANDPGVIALGGVWDAIKSMVHAAHYGEGIVLLSRSELNSSYYTNLVAKGALDVHESWKYGGKIVCHTGVNLATRMFGRATFENRKRALDLQRRYFSRFTKVPEWQRAVSMNIENEGFVRSTFGFYLMLYGLPFPKLKTGLAMLGSNPVAYFTIHAAIRADDDGNPPLAQVHDELLFEFPNTVEKDVCIDRIRAYMEFEVPEMPRFTIPVEISRASNWGKMETIYG